MNRFFRSALFPLIIIAALVWLALNTLGGHSSKVERQTTYYVYNLVRTNPSAITGPVTISPNKQELTLTAEGKKISVHYASAESEAALEAYRSAAASSGLRSRAKLRVRVTH